MRLKSVQRWALSAAALAASLTACEDKKTFRHDAEWSVPTRTPKAIRTDTPEGAAEAVETRLDDILEATQGVNSVADANEAVGKMKKAYADLETYYAGLTKQEPKVDGPNRQAVARHFFKTQQELAKSVADLFEKDQKIVEVIGGQLGAMPLVQNPPDPPPGDALSIDAKDVPTFDFDVPAVTPTPAVTPKAKASPKPH